LRFFSFQFPFLDNRYIQQKREIVLDTEALPGV
jgi:hypothetical protein